MTDPGRDSARTVSLLSGVLATIILVAACNGDGAAPTPAPASPGPSAPAGCRVQTTLAPQASSTLMTVCSGPPAPSNETS